MHQADLRRTGRTKTESPRRKRLLLEISCILLASELRFRFTTLHLSQIRLESEMDMSLPFLLVFQFLNK